MSPAPRGPGNSLAADRRPGSSSQQTRGASARPSPPLPARYARPGASPLRRPGRERAGANLAAHDEARRRRNRRGIPAGSGTRRRSSACASVSSNPRSDEDLSWDSSPADRAPGRTSRTCLGYQDRERGSHLGQIVDRAGNDSRESAGAFCCLSATHALETNARASLSHWRASSGNPAGAHENVLLVVVDPPLRKRNAGE